VKKAVIKDTKTLAELVSALVALGYRIGVTIGSWDLLHIGHVRYLIEAKKMCDILIVGVDTDRAIKLYKGPLRPVVPEDERCEMLTYQECVDFVVPIDDVDEKGAWQYELINIVKPNVFVAVEGSYPPEQLADIKTYCRELVVLPRQAEGTSTSDMIQNTLKRHLDLLYGIVQKGRG